MAALQILCCLNRSTPTSSTMPGLAGTSQELGLEAPLEVTQPSPCSQQGQLEALHGLSVFSWALKTSKERNWTDSLDNLLQCSVIKFYLSFK